jgi:hypothetical protein
VIVCRKCGRRTADGTEFCVCGAYLEFDGEHVPDAGGAAAASPPAAAAPPGPTGPLPPPPSAGAPASGSTWSRSPATARPAEAEPGPWSGFGGSTPAEPARPAGGIDAVHPDAPERPVTTQQVWVEAGARDGDVACRQCGTPNGPERFFCRHCGMSLTGAVDAATTPPPRRVPWWKRMFRGAASKASSTDATTALHRVHGLARGGLSGRTMLFRTGGVVVLLGGLFAFLGPWSGPAKNKARELIGADRHSAIDVAPEEVSAVATDPAIPPAPFAQQGPEHVVDRFANTAWATRWLDPIGPGFEEAPDGPDCQPQPSTDTRLVFEFAEPRDIGRMQVLAGRTAVDEGRTLFRRPRVLELQVDDGPCTYVVLDDVGELVSVDFEHDDVSTVSIGIVGVYEAEAPGEAVEISEVVFER